MNVEIGAEAELFPEKEYINGIAVAVHAIHSPFNWRILTLIRMTKDEKGLAFFKGLLL
jgi:hypothetical protein